MRIQGLDFLRGLAIILVLFRHGGWENMLHHAGWIGVDLFFVLSGFLVSGIVFREYQSTKQVDVKRFLIRRGLKIYPAFYAMIIATMASKFLLHGDFYEWENIFSEIFYLQSYREGLWLHTWSLAVEEHFYITWIIIALLIVRFGKLENVYLFMVGWFIFYAMTIAFRINISYLNRSSEMFAFFQTHLRIDGILIGVLVSYLYHFSNHLQVFFQRPIVVLFVALALISPAFIFNGGQFFMNAFGISIMNIGFGMLVCVCLSDLRFPKLILFPKGLFTVICFAGIHSYSIYLWHLFVARGIRKLDFSHHWEISTYLILSIAVGVVLSLVIEQPFLRWRDRYYKKTVGLSLNEESYRN